MWTIRHTNYNQLYQQNVDPDRDLDEYKFEDGGGKKDSNEKF